MSLIIDNLIKNSSALIVVNTFSLSFYEEFGISNTQTTYNSSITELNNFITSYATQNSARVFVVDFNRITRILGEEKSMDYRFGYSSKLYFKNDFFESYANEIAKTVKALMAKNKKCLVLDCDNTLWKGIIGEDGMDGIKLGKDSSPGNIFYDFQSSVLQLYERGVIIALCSKNNEEDVFEVLDNHPDSLIKKKHLGAWKINWTNKVQNIMELSKELNIGLDYFVFVDDNPMECNMIKESLPMVEVIQVPEKLYFYPNILFKDGLFDSLSYSDEDKKRNELYQTELLRKNSQKQFSDIKGYLHSLDIVVSIGLDHSSSIPRLAQLTQKTNQFNLTTKRYSEEDIKLFQSSLNQNVIQFSVKDKYGDMGLTGMAIFKIESKEVLIDTFLLSCRILGRDIELAFMNYCIDFVSKTYQPKAIKSQYIRTKKNAQTEFFWDKLNFELVNENNDKKEYQLNPDLFKKNEYDYITIQLLD